MLARLAGQSRLLVRLVEQSRRARRTGVRFRRDAAVRNGRSQDWHDACLCRAAPSDLVACIGSGYQRLYVIPSLDLIVVRQGEGGRFSDARFLRLLLGKQGSPL